MKADVPEFGGWFEQEDETAPVAGTELRAPRFADHIRMPEVTVARLHFFVPCHDLRRELSPTLREDAPRKCQSTADNTAERRTGTNVVDDDPVTILDLACPVKGHTESRMGCQEGDRQKVARPTSHRSLAHLHA